MKYEISKISRLGNRNSNQDRIGVVETERAVLLAVADGLGGYKGGEIAAETVVNCAIHHFKNSEFPIRNPGALIHEIILRAQRDVLSVAQANNPPLQAKSTCVICIIQDGFASWGHLGDSRLYVLRNGAIVKRTIDHSKVEEMFQKGLITEKQKLTHPEKNIITRCVGSETRRPKPTIAPAFTLQRDDVILLSSDGFWSPLSEKDIAAGLQKRNLHDAIEGLASDAEETSYPKSDNISVVGLRWLSVQQKKNPQPKQADPVKQTKQDIDEVNRELDDMIKKLKHIVGK